MIVKEKSNVTPSLKTTGSMKAVRIYSYGDSSVLKYEDAPIPEMLPDEVLIKVHAAAVNPVDWKIREGYKKDSNPGFPLTLGLDVAGTIVSVGKLVTLFKEGDEVIADTNSNGTYAEYVAVRSFELSPAPDSIALHEAAGIPLAAQTAWQGLFENGDLKKGQSILIHGASGGVGMFAVQFAKLAGAHVIGTTSAENIDLIQSLGADEVIDYKAQDFSREVHDVDMVFDTIGKETQQKSWQTLRKNGILVSTVGTDEKAAQQHQVRTKAFMMIASGSRLQQIVALVDKNRVRVIMDKEFPLAAVKEAHDRSKAGHATGKIILRVE